MNPVMLLALGIVAYLLIDEYKTENTPKEKKTRRKRNVILENATGSGSNSVSGRPSSDDSKHNGAGLDNTNSTKNEDIVKQETKEETK